MKFLMTIMLLVLGFTATAKAAVIGNNHVQVAEFLYDFAKDGGAVSQINLSTKLNNALPAGASILRIHYYVETAFTSAGSATVAIGDVGSAARYLAATAFDNAAFADENLALIASGVPHQIAAANDGKFAITVAGAALTAGKVRFYVEFIKHKE